MDQEVFPLPEPPFTKDTPVARIVNIDPNGPIIIDNGSYECRIGGSNHEKPPIIFKNESRRPRKNEFIPHGSNIGWEVTEEAWRFPTRNAFDHGILSNMDCAEDTLDFVFYSLGLSGHSQVSNPVAFSEPLCNPNYCRNLASELLFECYNVPAVGYYVDALASYHWNASRRSEISQKTSFIISSGHSATLLIPYVNGEVNFSAARRVDVGGMHMNAFAQTVLKLKYPDHRSSINAWVADYIQQHHVYFARDYRQELAGFYPDIHNCENRKLVRTVQLPVPAKEIPKPEPSDEEKERKRLEKIQQGQRLKAMAEKRRSEKLEEQREQLESMQGLLDRNLEPNEFEDEVKELGYTDVKDFNTELQRIKKSIAKANRPKEPTEKKETPLTEDDIFRMENFDQWVENNKSRQDELKQALEQRELARTSWSSRRSAESQNRLRLLNEAADTRSEDSEFDDWEVYITMQSDRMKEDDERDRKELGELVEKLQKYAPEHANREMTIEEYYQLKLGQERIRIPEVLHQPCMIGEDQMGLSECINSVLHSFSADIQTDLVNNIFVTGGCVAVPYFQQRLEHDLRRFRPTGSSFQVHTATDPLLDPWQGARQWSCEKDSLSQMLTKADYEEKGTGYLRPHRLSNCWYPSYE